VIAYFQDDEDSAEKLVPEGRRGGGFPYKGKRRGCDSAADGRGAPRAMGYVGCESIADMKQTRPEFVEITAAGVRESHVHDVADRQGSPQTNRVRMIDAQRRDHQGLPGAVFQAPTPAHGCTTKVLILDFGRASNTQLIAPPWCARAVSTARCILTMYPTSS